MINPGNKIIFLLLIAATAVVLQQKGRQPLATLYQEIHGTHATQIATSSHHHGENTQLAEDVASVTISSLSYSFLSNPSGLSSCQFFNHPIAVILEKQSSFVIPSLKRVFYHVVNINAP